mmetsp:Transcript_21616/g.46881  ORF Transcript_21616/g.46881 Transcript_21616/m.46881 type:complete len:327 (-) Transcript_21616:1297-2277(-)
MANQRHACSALVYSFAHTLFLLLPFTVTAFLAGQSCINLRHQPLAAYISQDDVSLGGAGGKETLTVNATLNGDTTFTETIDNDEIDIVGAGTLGDIMAGDSVSGNLEMPANPNPTTVKDGLVTKEGGELNARFNCNFTPMERIALTANGNLQRIFSSFYDAPVHVHVDSCARRELSARDEIQIGFTDANGFSTEKYRAHIDEGDAVWDRVVHLYVHDKTFCRATSVIHVRSHECIRLIEDGTVGLGQLFRYLNKLPTFSLLDAGRTEYAHAESEQSISKNDSKQALQPHEFEGGMWRTYELQCEELTCLIHEEFLTEAWCISPKPN